MWCACVCVCVCKRKRDVVGGEQATALSSWFLLIPRNGTSSPFCDRLHSTHNPPANKWYKWKIFFSIGSQLWMLWGPLCLTRLGSSAIVTLAQPEGSREEVSFPGSIHAGMWSTVQRSPKDWSRSQRAAFGLYCHMLIMAVFISL